MVPGRSAFQPFAIVSPSGLRRGVGGFTLVELMITIVVAAILAVVAVPSFHKLLLSNRLTTTADAMVEAINTARMDAVKLNSTTQFCSNNATANTSDTLGTACGTAAGAVYALPQNSSTAGEVHAATTGMDATLKISGNAVAVRFSGQGFGFNANGGSSSTPYTGRVAKLCTPSMASNNQRIITMTAGSILATASSSGTCP